MTYLDLNYIDPQFEYIIMSYELQFKRYKFMIMSTTITFTNIISVSTLNIGLISNVFY